MRRRFTPYSQLNGKPMNNPADYTNHSGGAYGADVTWDEIGREFGVINHIHWRPEHLSNMSEESRKDMLRSVQYAAIALDRPQSFRGIELVQRNWLPVHHAEAVFAISRIVQPNALDKGFVNKSGKEVVSGGTGWAVEMAIQKGKDVYVYDMTYDHWMFWAKNAQRFLAHPNIPKLTHKFAGIGSRELTPKGIQAIRGVYMKTFVLPGEFVLKFP